MIDSEIDTRKRTPPSIFEYQPPAVLNQAAPVNGTWYDILPTTANCRAYMIGACIEDTNEDIEVQVIIDGETIGATAVTATHSNTYYAFLALNAIARVDAIQLSNTNAEATRRAFQVEGLSVQIQVRKVTANGVGNLTGIVAYGVLTEI